MADELYITLNQPTQSGLTLNAQLWTATGLIQTISLTESPVGSANYVNTENITGLATGTYAVKYVMPSLSNRLVGSDVLYWNGTTRIDPYQLGPLLLGTTSVPITWIDGLGNPVPGVSWLITPGGVYGVADGSGTAAGRINLNNGIYTLISSGTAGGVTFPTVTINVVDGVASINGQSGFVIVGSVPSGGDLQAPITYVPLANGATLLATPSGGQSPYTFAWTGTGITFTPVDSGLTTATVATGGIYTAIVTVSDNTGDTVVNSITFNVVPPVVPEPAGAQVSISPGTVQQLGITGSVVVTLVRSAEQQRVFYTTNGRVPVDYGGTPYTGPFTITTACTLRVLFVNASTSVQQTSVAVFTITPP